MQAGSCMKILAQVFLATYLLLKPASADSYHTLDHLAISYSSVVAQGMRVATDENVEDVSSRHSDPEHLSTRPKTNDSYDSAKEQQLQSRADVDKGKAKMRVSSGFSSNSSSRSSSDSSGRSTSPGWTTPPPGGTVRKSRAFATYTTDSENSGSSAGSHSPASPPHGLPQQFPGRIEKSIFQETIKTLSPGANASTGKRKQSGYEADSETRYRGTASPDRDSSPPERHEIKSSGRWPITRTRIARHSIKYISAPTRNERLRMIMRRP